MLKLINMSKDEVIKQYKNDLQDGFIDIEKTYLVSTAQEGVFTSPLDCKSSNSKFYFYDALGDKEISLNGTEMDIYLISDGRKRHANENI